METSPASKAPQLDDVDCVLKQGEMTDSLTSVTMAGKLQSITALTYQKRLHVDKVKSLQN